MHDHGFSHHKYKDGSGSEKVILIAFALNLAFACIELFGGLWLQSMAILADAVHDFGDSLSIGFAWYMQRLSNRGATHTYSYGYRRFSILSVIVISSFLISGSAVIVYESIQRLFHPIEAPDPFGMIGFAVFGIVINGIAGKLLAGGGSLNEKVLSWHFWEDVLGWVAVLVGGVGIYLTNLPWIDPLLSLAIAVFVAYRVLNHLKQALAIILQATPDHFDIEHIEQAIMQSIEIESIRHTHLWTLDGENHILTSHLVFKHATPLNRLMTEKQKAHELLKSMGIDHATFEIEVGEPRKDLAES